MKKDQKASDTELADATSYRLLKKNLIDIEKDAKRLRLSHNYVVREIVRRHYEKSK